ncbi:P-loop containing nucleoside triphosphate hydrolase protein [Lentinula raphanica]|nr:P-loop containing nucleoside triphosphate hydrolase protein [Lentinula raphanica]
MLDLPGSDLPWTFLNSLSNKEQLVAFKFCLLLWYVTQGSQIPRQIQLESALSVYQKKDTLLVAGTNTGKTLVVILLALLQKPGQVTLMVSPFKRLQESMAKDMRERYNLNVLVINEETTRDNDWWTKNVFNTMTKCVGPVDIVITTLEQCFRSREGHLPRLGQLLRCPAFQSRIEYEVVDEIHESEFSGQPHYGLGAFRPAWGRLGEMKRLLANSTVLGLSATVPNHILPSVNQAMGDSTYVRIQNSFNRRNVTYASHCINGTLDDIANYRCFVAEDFDPMTHKRILFFCDNRKQTWLLRNTLEGFLPPEWRGKGIVQHYHSQMSKQFLEHVHVAFTEEGGSCRFLVATSAESTGVDFPDIDIVVNVGLPPSKKDAIQRAGRVIRREGKQGLFLILYEPWVLEVDLSEYDDQWVSDPDRPRKKLNDNSNRRDRAPFSMVRMIKHKECQRHSYAEYLGDQHELALEYVGEYCCDSVSHGRVFPLQDFLPANLFSDPQIDEVTPKSATQRNKYRPVPQREDLVTALKRWRRLEYLNSSLRAVYQEWLILDDRDIESIARLHPDKMTSIKDLYQCMHHSRSDEWKGHWGSKIYNFLREFNHVHRDPKSTSSRKRKDESQLPSTVTSKRQKVSSSNNASMPLQPSSHRLIIRIPPRSQHPHLTKLQESFKENI